MLGKTMWEIYGQRLPGFETECRQAMTTGRTVRIEEYDSTRNEWHEHTVYPAPVGVNVTVRDITDRKRVDQELKRRGAQLQEALRLAHLGTWEWDVTTNTVLCSDELCRICGVNPQDFVATFESVLNLVHPDDRDAIAALV